MKAFRFAAATALACLPVPAALAQAPAVAPSPATPVAPDTPEAGRSVLRVSAVLTSDGQPVRNGLVWRVFGRQADRDGRRAVVAQSQDPQPSFVLPNGNYVVHATYGFASALRPVTLSGRADTEKLTLMAGALEVKGMLGDQPITPDKLNLSIYVPERGNAEAKLVVENAKPGQVLRLPEGLYHLVSTYLDTVGVGSLTPVTDTNSIVNADLRVQAGKLVEATVRHRAAVLTLKLVNNPGGEAIANTSFTILTPGGDVIRDLIGAFPSLVLAEGDYLLIARHDGKTFQGEFKVQSNLDRDVEVLARSPG